MYERWRCHPMRIRAHALAMSGAHTQHTPHRFRAAMHAARRDRRQRGGRAERTGWNTAQQRGSQAFTHTHCISLLGQTRRACVRVCVFFCIGLSVFRDTPILWPCVCVWWRRRVARLVQCAPECRGSPMSNGYTHTHTHAYRRAEFSGTLILTL